jgi:putative transposase
LLYSGKAIQVDWGSELRAESEQACKEKGIKLFVLPPRSPKLNVHAERHEHAHTDEFHGRYTGNLGLKQLNKAMRQREFVYNHVRHHHFFAFRTAAG